jgi:tetratricopeptide (TPR) repeat protein
MFFGKRRLQRFGLPGDAHQSRSSVGAAIALTCAFWLHAAPALAQSTSDELARRHFDSGVAYLEESDYDNALKAFQKSYELSKRPEILLNIATVQERKGDLSAAVTALRSYLEAAPQGEHADTVRLRIQNLEKRLQAQASAQPAQPDPALAPPPPAPTPAKTAEPARTPPPPPPKAEPNRLPAFISLGVGGLLGGASLATGLLANSKYQDAKSSCSPRCSDADLSSTRTLAITSTVLTGAAVLGVGLGVALLLTSEGDEAELARKTPRIDVALGPSSAAASAAWRF